MVKALRAVENRYDEKKYNFTNCRLCFIMELRFYRSRIWTSLYRAFYFNLPKISRSNRIIIALPSFQK